MKMAEFDYQWKYTLEKEDLENEEDKYRCNEKRINEFLEQFKSKKWFSKIRESFPLIFELNCCR